MNKAYITKQGKITKSTILLLGKPESKHFIEPAQPLITWVLRNEIREDFAYEHFHLPFILASSRLYAKIRNLKYVYMQDNTLFPTEIDMYDPFLIREALHNCIAHQDYQQGRRINMVEYPNELLLTNAGSFIPESIENVIDSDAPPDLYRNPFLATAMTNLKMIDIRGGGIKKMFSIQRKRFFPMPDYDLSSDMVKVKIFGKILDENYTKLLIKRTDLDLKTVILLDFVQKGKGDLVSTKQANYLRNEKLIEGRKPNYFVSGNIAQLTDDAVQYTKNKAFEKQKYKDYIIKHIDNHGSATRKEIDALLFNVMPIYMTEKQKKTRIHNLMTKMSGKIIKNIGSRKHSKWVMIENK